MAKRTLYLFLYIHVFIKKVYFHNRIPFFIFFELIKKVDITEQEQLDYPEFDVSVSQHSNSSIDSDETAYSKIRTSSNDSDISNDLNNIGTFILVDIPLTNYSHSFCFIFKTPSGNYIDEECYIKILYFILKLLWKPII
jgi:hypothetical protein